MKVFIYSIFVLTLFCGCGKSNIDVSKVDIHLKFKRLDKDIFEQNYDSVIQSVPKLRDEYGKFLDLYSTQILKIGNTSDSAYGYMLREFSNHKDWRDVYIETQKVFQNIDKIDQELILAFKHYKYYFPSKLIPDIYYHISGFNQSVVTDSSLIGIGLDKYLGSKSVFYEYAQIENYRRYNMRPERISPDVMKAWFQMEFPYNDSVETLVSRMIYEGITLCFMKEMLPNIEDSLLIGYSGQQYNWCIKHQKEMWDYMIKHKLLYSSEFKDIRTFVNETPFTTLFTKESPGKTGVWMGWQIVKKFIDDNDYSLPQLVQIRDYHWLFAQSNFKP